MLKAIALHQTRWSLAALRVQLAVLRRQLALRAYNPGQLRVPAGNPAGGQWTDGDGGGGSLSDDGARLIPIADRNDRGYGVLLAEEEDRGGHTLREHVGKTDAEMMSRVQGERWRFPLLTFGRTRDGAFASQEAANDFVNRTLEENSSAVDAVSSGDRTEAFLTHRFGYRTGREAYRLNDERSYPRDTFSAGVLIRHDATSARGFRVITAYPRNDSD